MTGPLLAIPAAGTSSRMRGRDKLLEVVDGLPLVRRQAMAAVAVADTLVLLPPDAPGRRKALDGLPLRIEPVPDHAEGLSASLRRAANIAGGRALAILLPDVPGVTEAEINAVISAFARHGGDHVVRASDPEGRPGTPVVIPPRLLPRVRALRGDQGARTVLDGEKVLLVRFGDDRATRDLDTPEDWADWRARKDDSPELR